MEEVLEVLVGKKGTEEGTIVTVGGRTAEADGADEIEHHGGPAEWTRWLLDQGLLESLITNDDLDVSDDWLLVKLRKAVSIQVRRKWESERRG